MCSHALGMPGPEDDLALFPQGSPMWKVEKSLNFCRLNGKLPENIKQSEPFQLDIIVPADNKNGCQSITQLKLMYMLAHDVLNYFSLTETFKSSAEAQQFKETLIYANYQNQLALLTEKAISAPCYTVADLYHPRALKDGRLVLTCVDGSFHPCQGETSYQSSMVFETCDKHFDKKQFITPSISEETACKIQQTSCAVISVVKLKENDSLNYRLNCVPTDVYIASRETGEIFWHYEVSAVIDNSELSALNDIRREPATQMLSKTIYADTEPLFNGNMNQWLSQHLFYPSQAVENGVQGRVLVLCVIDEEGVVRNAQIRRGVDPLLDLAALWVVRTMPKWTPGMKDGKPCRTYHTIPVTFRLQ